MRDVHVATTGGLFTLGEARSTEISGRAVVDFSWNENGWWAIAHPATVLHKPLGGQWGEVTTVEGRVLNCLLLTANGALVGTDRAHLLSVSSTGAHPVAAFEEAPGRDEWFTPWGGPPDVRSLAQGSEALYVNVHVGGILRSNDGGARWTQTIDIRSDVHEVITAGTDNGEVVVAAAAVGLAVSRDAGASWEIDAEGLHSSYARAVALDHDHLLMTAATGPRGGQAGIYKRALESPGTFRKTHEGLPDWFPQNIDSGTLDARDGTAAFGTADGRVYLSENDGDKWELIADDLSAVRRVRLSA